MSQVEPSTLEIFLDRGAPQPLAQQLRGQLSLRIRTGDLAPNTRMPTVRALADALDVNRNTVQKVYASLQRAGLVVTRVGDGTYVAANRVTARLSDQTMEGFRSAIRSAFEIGADAADIRLAFELQMWRELNARGKKSVQMIENRRLFAYRRRF